MKHSQYTIRNIPPEIDARLRAAAIREQKSLNKVVLEALSSSLRQAAPAKQSTKINHDFDEFFGSWKAGNDPGPGFDEAIADQEQIDLKDWQ